VFYTHISYPLTPLINFIMQKYDKRKAKVGPPNIVSLGPLRVIPFVKSADISPAKDVHFFAVLDFR
jgi:hypothetical protein